MQQANVTKRERVKMAVHHIKPDVVPWTIDLTGAALIKLADYYADQRLTNLAYFNNWVGNHFVTIGPSGKGQFHGLEDEVQPGIWRDGWGINWDTRGIFGEGEWGRPVNCILPDPTLENYEFPEPPNIGDYAKYPSFIEENKDKFIIGQEGHLFETAWALRGLENFLMDMVLNPKFVHTLMERITSYYLNVIEHSLKYDIDAFAFGEDWGSQNRGLMMGPGHWRRFIKPYLARMFEPIKKAGKIVYLHSDGQVNEIFDDLIEIGLDIYNPFQPEIMDVYQVKKDFGERLCFHGGIGIQDLLVNATPKQVETEVRHMINIVGAGGGYVMAPAHDVLADTPAENIAAMLEVLFSQ